MTRKPLTPDRAYRRARLALICAIVLLASAGAVTALSGSGARGSTLLFPCWFSLWVMSWNVGWLKGHRAARTGTP